MNKKEIDERAKEIFGFSSKCGATTFITRNGDAIDMTKGTSTSRQFHGHEWAIEKIMGESIETEDFLNKTGYIRYFPQLNEINIMVDVGHSVTEDQLAFLDMCVCGKRPKKYLYYDIIHDGDVVRSFGASTINREQCPIAVDKFEQDFKKQRRDHYIGGDY